MFTSQTQMEYKTINDAVRAEVPTATDWTDGNWARVDGQRITVNTKTATSAPDTFDGPPVSLTYWTE